MSESNLQSSKVGSSIVGDTNLTCDRNSVCIGFGNWIKTLRYYYIGVPLRLLSTSVYRIHGFHCEYVHILAKLVYYDSHSCSLL